MEYSIGQLSGVATKILEHASKTKTEGHATLITFSGDLGAGKTTLIQEIARQLGLTETLQSPTFVIYKRYAVPLPPPPNPLLQKEGESNPWKHLIHGDMYRLESASEIEKLGWNELLNDSSNIICIEWPEMVESVIPDYAIRIKISSINEATRSIDISSSE